MKFFTLRQDIFHDIIECLIAALEAKDVYTKGHSIRVADMTVDLAKKIGLRGKELEKVHIAAHLHDIGKIGISDQILNKKSKLLPHEFEIIKMHPVIGYNILIKSKRLKEIAQIVLYHHERWDGRGYPDGLKETRIPLGARIISICDSIDAMASNRAYRQRLPWEQIKNEILNYKGLQFDPVIVDEIDTHLWNKWGKMYEIY
ncbi:MAG: HD-GYP domain-containing protein [Thermoanaerobacteraceae bacterium]